jgi:hypothetical protein
MGHFPKFTGALCSALKAALTWKPPNRKPDKGMKTLIKRKSDMPPRLKPPQ